jgi:hypothetical protein
MVGWVGLVSFDVIDDEMAFRETHANYVGYGDISGNGPPHFTTERDVANASDGPIGVG